MRIIEKQDKKHPSRALEVEAARQYQSASRKERDAMWLMHPEYRTVFDELDRAEVFLTDWHIDGFRVYRFTKEKEKFSEYRNLF